MISISVGKKTVGLLYIQKEIGSSEQIKTAAY